MMLCAHIKSGYDSRDDVINTKNEVKIPEMMFCALIKSGYHSRDDSMSTHMCFEELALKGVLCGKGSLRHGFPLFIDPTAMPY